VPGLLYSWTSRFGQFFVGNINPVIKGHEVLPDSPENLEFLVIFFTLAIHNSINHHGDNLGFSGKPGIPGTSPNQTCPIKMQREPPYVSQSIQTFRNII
jgi:hypothetical protein